MNTRVSKVGNGRGRRNRSAVVGALLSILAVLPVAMAEEEPEGTEQAVATRVEEIVVTARKRQESLQEVPVAVTAISGARLDNTFYRDLQDIEGYAPNVVIDPVTAGPQGAALSIRGISFQDIEKSFDPAIGIFLDEVYIGTNSSALLNNLDIAEVEILRGPQGTLHGKNTTGGAIRLTRSRPTGELGGNLSITVGRFNRFDLKGLINTPIIEDKLAFKAFFGLFTDDGSFVNVTLGERVQRTDLINTGFALLATPTDDLEFLLSYEWIRDRSPVGPLINQSQPADSLDTPGGDLECTLLGFCAVEGNPRETTQNFSNYMKNDLHAVTLRADWTLEPGTITSIAAWRGNSETVNQDFDADSVDFFSSIRDQRYDQFSEELRFTSDLSDTFDFIGGLYYWYARYRLKQDTLFIPEFVAGAPPGTITTQRTQQTTHSIAPFLEGNFHATDWLTLTAGVRYTYEYKKIDEFSVSIPIPPFDNFCAAEGIDCSDSWDEFTPMASINLDIDELLTIPGNDGAMAYFRYARGFKSGGYNGRAGSPTSLGPYDPETVDLFEVGLRTDWWDNRLRINPTLFWNEYKDKQEEIVRPQPILGQETVVENASEATTRGVELEATLIPFDGMTLIGTFGYLDAQFDSFLADTTGDGVKDSDFSDLKLRRAPEFTYSIIANYVLEAGPGQIVTNANWRWNDTIETTAQNFSFGTTKAVGILDLSLGYDYPDLFGVDWRINAFGRNVTNETFRAAALGVGGLFSFGAVNEAATWGLELAAAF